MTLSTVRISCLRGFIAASSLAVAIACGGNKTPAGLPDTLGPAAPLLDSVGNAVPGLSQEQSALGVGSLLGLAKSRLPDSQFNRIGAAIPGSDALVNEAAKKGLPDSVGNLSDVTKFLGKSGISPDQVNQMVPVLNKAVTDKVSPELASTFKSVMK